MILFSQTPNLSLNIFKTQAACTNDDIVAKFM